MPLIDFDDEEENQEPEMIYPLGGNLNKKKGMQKIDP